MAAHCTGKRALILGGSGFMGKALTAQLLDAGCAVTLLNRGQTPVSTAAAQNRLCARRLNALLRSQDGFGQRPQLTRLLADRDDRAAFRTALAMVVASGDVDFAVDFSAFSATHVADAARVLAGRVGHYIFISTNSVYQSDQHVAADAYDEEVAFELPVPTRNRDAYGWDKRACEELLVACAACGGGLPATRLRIPAICGPGDPTQRWWRYLLWLQSGQPLYSLKGSPVDEHGRLPSYAACYSLDVVQAVSSRFPWILVPRQNFLFTPELQWQSRGKRRFLQGCRR